MTDRVAIPRKQLASSRENGRQPMIAENRSWQELCVAASQEPDPERLIAIISELMKALDERKTVEQRLTS
jgi:hypothetical protein